MANKLRKGKMNTKDFFARLILSDEDFARFILSDESLSERVKMLSNLQSLLYVEDNGHTALTNKIRESAGLPRLGLEKVPDEQT